MHLINASSNMLNFRTLVEVSLHIALEMLELMSSFKIDLGPYDFYDAETDCIMQNVTEFDTFFNEQIKSRSVHLNQMAIWTNACEY